ncbi:MAG: DNA alkylation repair protein [Candidatus Omnitrophota bacterium]
MECNDVIKKLKSLGNSKSKQAIARYGITPEESFCVSLPNLRMIAKEIGKNHQLALELWKYNIRETRILASMIDEPLKATKKQMEDWAGEFSYWEICDQCCMNLFKKHKSAYELPLEWSRNKKEFIKRAGFVVMACLAVSDKKAEDSKFEVFFSIIKREAEDNRHMVKKAVNWALRQIGKRNLNLNKKAIEAAIDIQNMDSGGAKWIASDAIRELMSESTRRRLKR